MTTGTDALSIIIFQSSVIMEQALNASEAEIVTVALRRVDINDDNDDILNHIDKNK